MGYTTGIEWSYELIKEELMKIIMALDIDRMPTSVEIKNVTQNSKLVNAIRRHGGYIYWSQQLEKKQAEGKTRLGQQGEEEIKKILESKNYKVDRMSVKHPYDLLVNENIKIDVKTGRTYIGENGYKSHSFNLEKANPTCDIYILYCIDTNVIYVIPSKFAKKTQISIGEKSAYDSYIDRWEYIKIYDDFYKTIK